MRLRCSQNYQASVAPFAYLIIVALTKRMSIRGALIGLGLWLVVQFAAGFVVSWDAQVGDAAITLGVFMGMILSFALFQLHGSFRSSAH